MEIIEKARVMLEKYPLCDHCLGRQFAFLGFGIENDERGKTIKTALTMWGHQLRLSKDRKGTALLKLLATNGSFRMANEILRKMRVKVADRKTCFLCEGHFDALSPLVDTAAKILQDYEYDSFLIGVNLPVDIEEREDEFKAELGIQYGESMRNEFSRVFGKMISQVTGKSVDYMKPQIVILINPFTQEVKLQVNSLFIMGRYRKLIRGIPQSRWPCTDCRGKGCQKCNWTGKMYPESVEELVGEPVLEITQGENFSFHGAGREDIDARMLGRGRPFVIEIKKPRKRTLELSDLRRVINERASGKIEVTSLRFVDRDMVRKLKRAESSQKLYRVLVKFDRNIEDSEIKKIEDAFTNVTVLQRTPLRVLHRRADIIREKEIYETRIKRLSQNSIEMRIRCQGGLYIKELVTGDEGRTEPNVSKIANSKAEPIKLDVLDVSFKGGKP